MTDIVKPERILCTLCGKTKTRNTTGICSRHTIAERDRLLVQKIRPVQMFENRLNILLEQFNQLKASDLPSADPFDPEEVKSKERIERLLNRVKQSDSDHKLYEFTDTESTVTESDYTNDTFNDN